MAELQLIQIQCLIWSPSEIKWSFAKKSVQVSLVFVLASFLLLIL